MGDEVVAHTYAWHWKRRYAEILEQLTLDDVVRFYRERVVGAEAKWISIQLFHQKDAEGKKKKEGGHGQGKERSQVKVHRKHGKQKHHRIVARQSDQDGILYFNRTKDLQNLEQYAQYFDVY